MDQVLNERITKQLHMDPVILVNACMHGGIYMFKHTSHETYDKITTFTKMTLGFKSNQAVKRPYYYITFLMI